MYSFERRVPSPLALQRGLSAVIKLSSLKLKSGRFDWIDQTTLLCIKCKIRQCGKAAVRIKFKPTPDWRHTGDGRNDDRFSIGFCVRAYCAHYANDDADDDDVERRVGFV